MSESKESSRYPYTFAYDWLRSAGVAGSRGDAAQWAKLVAPALGMTKDELCIKAADEYIAHWNAMDDLDEKKAKAARFWSSLTPPKPL